MGIRSLARSRILVRTEGVNKVGAHRLCSSPLARPATEVCRPALHFSFPLPHLLRVCSFAGGRRSSFVCCCVVAWLVHRFQGERRARRRICVGAERCSSSGELVCGEEGICVCSVCLFLIPAFSCSLSTRQFRWHDFRIGFSFRLCKCD